MNEKLAVNVDQGPKNGCLNFGDVEILKEYDPLSSKGKRSRGNDLLGEGQCSPSSFLVIVVKKFAQHTSTAQLMSHDSAKYMFIHWGIYSELSVLLFKL